MSSYVDSLVPLIRTILKKSDLNTVSAKAIRKQLVAEGEDEAKVKDARSEIDAKIAELFDEACDAANGESEPESPPPPKPKATSSRAKPPAPAPAKKKKVTKSKKRVASDGESDDDEKPKKKRGGGGGGAFNKELVLSDSLSAFLNETRLSRPQTVKRIWDYVKAHDLQDPSDRRFILCDDTMKTVFHTDKLHMFTMNKLLAQHFRDPDAA